MKIFFRLATVTTLLLFFSAVSVHAQEEVSAPEEVPAWVKTFGKQLKGQLESKDPAIQSQALQHITYFSSFYQDQIDFSDAVPTLLDLYRKDDDANVRLFALVALHSIGDKRGMQEVRSSLYDQRWPPRLQLVTLAALVDHYGAETFEMDRRAAAMAKNVIKYYKPKPRIDLGPMEMVGFEEMGEEESEGQQ